MFPYLCFSDDIDSFLLDETRAELGIENLNGFQRRLVYQTIESKYFNKVTAATSNNILVVRRRVSDEEMKKLEDEKCRKEKEHLEDQIGMTLLIKAISESVKFGFLGEKRLILIIIIIF